MKCYQCETTTNEGCSYLQFHKSTIKPQECASNRSLSEIGYVPSCLKILTTNCKFHVNIRELPNFVSFSSVDHGKIVIHQYVRRCLWKTENQDPCSQSEILRPYEVHRTAYQTCDICNDKDGCNSANYVKYFWNLMVLGVIFCAAQ